MCALRDNASSYDRTDNNGIVALTNDVVSNESIVPLFGVLIMYLSLCVCLCVLGGGGRGVSVCV